MLPSHERLMEWLEERDELDREIEFLPSAAEIPHRLSRGARLRGPSSRAGLPTRSIALSLNARARRRSASDPCHEGCAGPHHSTSEFAAVTARPGGTATAWLFVASTAPHSIDIVAELKLNSARRFRFARLDCTAREVYFAMSAPIGLSRRKLTMSVHGPLHRMVGGIDGARAAIPWTTLRVMDRAYEPLPLSGFDGCAIESAGRTEAGHLRSCGLRPGSSQAGDSNRRALEEALDAVLSEDETGLAALSVALRRLRSLVR
ncbi:hypothetical protein FQR65_LT20657 [Abscondita terminalis]|nr:hypothetical protein FQR65_LT20657 [Abscondita terminalis]